MSRSGHKARGEASQEALDALEEAVDGALKRVRELDERARAAEARQREIEELLGRMSDGDVNPASMQTRMNQLESDNGELRRRLDEGREAVDRLLAKIRFLEEQR